MGTRQSDPALGLNAAVAAVLEGERAAAGWTLRELADASGVSYRTLQRLLKSRDRHIDIAVLGQLAEAFHVQPEAIIATARERQARFGDPEEAAARAIMRAELERRDRRPRKTSAPVKKATKARNQA